MSRHVHQQFSMHGVRSWGLFQKVKSQVFKDKCRRVKAGKENDKDVTVVDSDEGDISDEE